MILVDTSVWIDHLRRGNAELARLLEEGDVVVHPFVVGELACGKIENRIEILELLRKLPETSSSDHDEALHLIESGKLQGRGLGWIDVHLLASARISDCAIWTQDRVLARAAVGLGVSA